MTVETWLTFLAVWLLAAAAPGANVAFTVATGLSTPLPRAFWAPVGIGIGGLVYAAGVSAGLGTLLAASADIFAVIKWLGVAYLLWLAVRQWRAGDRATAMAAPAAQPKAGSKVCLQALTIMMANPKAALAYAAVFPAFVAPEAPAWPQFAILSATSAAASITVHCAYIGLAHRLGAWQRMRRRPALVHRVSAGIYLVAAAALALVRRAGAAV